MASGGLHSLRFRILASVVAGVGLLAGTLGLLVLRANEENTRYVLRERLALAHTVQRAVDAEVQLARAVVQRLALQLRDRSSLVRWTPNSPVDRVAVLPAGHEPRSGGWQDPLRPEVGQVLVIPRGPGELEIWVSASAGRHGWVVGRLSRARLAQLLAPPPHPHGYFVQLVGPAGWLAVRRERNEAAHASLCRQVLAGGGGVVFHPAGPPDGDHYLVCTPLDTLPGWGIALERAPDGILLLHRQVRRIVAVAGAVLLAGAAVAAWLDVQRVLRPLRRLGAEAERVGAGELQRPINIGTADAELQELAAALDRMRVALGESLAQARQRGAHLQAVHEVALEILRAKEGPQVLDIVVQRTRELLHGDLSVLCTCQGGVVQPVAWAGSPAPDPRPVPGCPPHLCPVLPDAYRTTRWAAPIRQAHGIVGWLCVGRGDPQPLRPEERGLLESLAALAGVALENLRLRGELRRLSVLEERARVARELHDGLAQTLGIIHAFASTEGEGAPARRALARIRQLAAEAYGEVRQAIYGLRIPHGADFICALRNYAQQFSQQTGLPVELRVEGPIEDPLPPEVEVQLVRILQEALTNVWRHAKASRARLVLVQTPEYLEASVEDDGVGFDAGAVEGRGHFGLLGMRERAASIGAQLSIQSAPGAGTRVLLRLPRRAVWRKGWIASA